MSSTNRKQSGNTLTEDDRGSGSTEATAAVLVVDDEFSLRDSLESWFRKDGYRSGSAKDANDGSEAAPWKTIQHAADAARAGDVDDEDLRKITGGMTKADLINAVAAGKRLAGFFKKPPSKKPPL